MFISDLQEFKSVKIIIIEGIFSNHYRKKFWHHIKHIFIIYGLCLVGRLLAYLMEAAVGLFASFESLLVMVMDFIEILVFSSFLSFQFWNLIHVLVSYSLNVVPFVQLVNAYCFIDLVVQWASSLMDLVDKRRVGHLSSCCYQSVWAAKIEGWSQSLCFWVQDLCRTAV